MQGRMNNPALVLPGALEALQSLSKAAKAPGLPQSTIDLVHIRASQINGCSVCVDMHTRAAHRHGEKEERLFTVAAWRDAPYFSEEERAALALAEAITRIADRPDGVADEVVSEASKYYDEKALAALIVQIAEVNVFNRINVTARTESGAWTGQVEG